MDSRREFLKKAALLSGGAGMFKGLPASVQRALAIDPVAGSTYLDAEHVVILMQENRSFDHCYGSLQGVRGFNDPRAITLPDGDPVWFQKNELGEIYTPFRLNIKETKSTWTGSLPHSWTNQVDALNKGKMDRWLIAKPSGHKEFAKAPLTMGYYNREDIPFYYALADAFTICDQNFCSSLTGTTPNRLFLWTGTVRQEQNESSYANVRNENVDYNDEVHWTTFPERLEDNNVSWKIYQNELSLSSGLSSEEDSWLANFTDNPIEWFSQYKVRFSGSHQRYLREIYPQLPGQISKLTAELEAIDPSDPRTANLKTELQVKKSLLHQAETVQEKYSGEDFAKLSDRDKNLHSRAFVTNNGDPDYRTVAPYRYKDGDKEREMNLPKGDILYQFRKDVAEDKLPAVSWLVGPENFSDHPGAPWYGAWYVSEVLDILTQKPELWKKTIFILCYDENDGYYDHVPPFVAPDPYRPGNGLVSKGIDTKVEYVTLEQDMKRKSKVESRESAIGLGFRVPLVVASPWSRGGHVCSQVFDHTSILQFLEKFLSAKTGREIKETNISAWRRTVCGDLSSVFTQDKGTKSVFPAHVIKNSFYESVHKAQFLKDPSGYRALSAKEVEKAKSDLRASGLLKQEVGIRPACPLPYELYADGNLSSDKKEFKITMASLKNVFKNSSAGCPFIIYAGAPHVAASDTRIYDPMRSWNYAVSAGDQLADSWLTDNFDNKIYKLQLHGPNGFYRRFEGNDQDPSVDINCAYIFKPAGKNALTGEIELKLQNWGSQPLTLSVVDKSYKSINMTIKLAASGNKDATRILTIPTSKSFGWYDFVVLQMTNKIFVKQFAGHVETGMLSFTDPAMK